MNVFLLSLNINWVIILGFIFLFIIPLFLIKINKKILYKTYIFTYTILLFFGVLSDISIKNNTMFISLVTTEKIANNFLSISYVNIYNITINLLLFFPFGVTLPLINKNCTLLKLIIFSLFLSIFIEFLQFLLPIIRYPEVLDVITNIISVILGYIYYLLISKSLFRSDKNDKLSKQKKY